jgi:hypothetical protein
MFRALAVISSFARVYSCLVRLPHFDLSLKYLCIFRIYQSFMHLSQLICRSFMHLPQFFRGASEPCRTKCEELLIFIYMLNVNIHGVTQGTQLVASFPGSEGLAPITRG